jgi:ATP-dependent helicase/nuclease subunit A
LNSQVDYHAEDEATRARIRELLDETLFVEAGAGTGKTRALVDRVVALVLSGRPVERIAAITFTEKAAAELKDRVRGELEKHASQTSGEAHRVEEALASLDRAQISTIHAFGLGLLRGFSAEAAVDPGFEVQDEVAAERRFEERWRSYLEDLASDGHAVDAVNRVLDLGLTTAEVQKLARELWLQPELAPLLDERPIRPEAAAWPGLAKIDARLAALPANLTGVADPLTAKLTQLKQLVGRLQTAPGEAEATLAAHAPMLLTSWNAGRQQDWGGAAPIGLVRDTAREVCVSLNETLAALRAEALAGLLPFIVRFVLEDEDGRGREGKLVFHDLVLRVRHLLRGDRNARIALRSRLDALLIDEFQDTDPLQVEIALAFATNPETGQIDKGRLFLVGDPKQSIYRFRRADMAVYARTRALMEEAGARAEQLSLNRRSRAEVIEWVNQIFDRVIGAGDRPELQPPYEAIHPHRAEALAGPGVAHIGGLIPGQFAREVRRQEATAIAAHCRGAVEEGWQVLERRQEGDFVRNARYRDIAVLIPTRTALQTLERALADAAIPYRVEGGSLIYATQEVREIVNCLAAIEDPADEVAVVAALRSPAYACSDVEIAGHKLAGGSFSYLHPRLDERMGRVADALRNLRAFHDGRHAGSLASLVERFIADRGLVQIGVLDQGGRNSFRRARFIVEQARVFEATRPESLRAFVQWMERRASGALRDHEGASLDDDEDAVRILTIHAAKGLEFPIVFLAGLCVGPSNETPVLAVDRSTDEIAVAIGTKGGNRQFLLGPADRLVQAEKDHDAAERRRLLYVAATRARDHLVVSLFHNERARGTYAHTLIDAGITGLCAPLPEREPVVRDEGSPLEGLVVGPSVAPEDFDKVRLELVATGTRRKYTSATALVAGGRARGAEQDKEERRDETEPWARGRAATRLGRAVHAALQGVAWEAEQEAIEAIARAQAVAEAIPDQADEVAQLVRRGLASQAAHRARAAKRALREVPFATRHEDVVVEGFVDLVIESDAGLEVVDWKTDRIPSSAVAGRLREYELQAGLYVLGLQEATGMRVASVTYVFVSAGEEVSPGEPQGLADRAEVELRAMARQ